MSPANFTLTLHRRHYDIGISQTMNTHFSARTSRTSRMLRLMALAALFAVTACSKDEPAAEKPKEPEAQATSPNTVGLDAKAVQAADIRVAQAGPAAIQQTLTLYGSVQSNAEREGSIRARYPGTIRSISKRLGDTVSKGAPLLSIESSESLQTYSLAAPINGIVIERAANVGETVDTEQVLIRIADLSTVWVEFAVFARDLGRVRVGSPITVAGSDGTPSAQSTINYIAPVGEAGNQSIVARAQIENKEGLWVPGQFITGEAVVGQTQAAVAVEPGALQTLSGKTVVFVQTARGFEARPIEVGGRSDEAIEVRSGLTAGERYVAANSYLLKADLTKGEAEEE